jgi:hypothetical protein
MVIFMGKDIWNLPHHRRLWITAMIALVFVGCAPSLKWYPQMNQCLQNRQYDAALKLIDQNKASYSQHNAVLFYLDQGLVAHYGGYYEQSNQALSKAESLMQDLYTTSISKKAATFLINDNAYPYRGEDFESALVNLFMAINYAAMQQWDDALVEARKVDAKLGMFNAQYGANEKNAYEEDAFIRFLMGILYEADGEVNDAFISYRKAEEIYRGTYRRLYGLGPPYLLLEKYIYTAESLRFNSEIRSLRRIYPRLSVPSRRESPKTGDVYLIHYNGFGAEKVQNFFLVRMPDRYVLKLPYPVFKDSPCRTASSKVILNEVKTGRSFELRTVAVENISGIARLNLHNRIARIKLKAFARVTAKYIAAKEAEKKARKDNNAGLANLIHMFSQTAMIVSEQADIRHWRTLPAQIRLGEAILPPGTYQGSVQLLDRNGGTLKTIPIPNFSVNPGEKRILTVRSFM